MRHTLLVYVLVAAVAWLAAPARADSPDALQTELNVIQRDWAVANYEVAAGEPRVRAFEALEKRVEQLVAASPGRAEPLIWQGIVLSTYAGAKGGLGALGLAKRSRAALEAAMKIDPHALSGSAYTSLGALYYKVPGFPVGFGNKNKARENLQRALALDPNGIDSNFFYAEFLLEQGERRQALDYLEKAKRAAPRPGRELADQGRRHEIESLLAKANLP
jgi:tetratricopeptide (TPR) repeat protein